MDSVEQKNRVQQRVLDYSDENHFQLLGFPTGTGKTLASLKVAHKHNDLPWLILCKERNHITEWEKEIEKHDIEIDATIMCYHSLHKIQGEYNIICDEAHALTVKRRNQIKKNIKYKRILFLTATLPENKEGHLRILSRNKLQKLIIKLSKAIELGLIPAPQINVYVVTMTDAQKVKYNTIDSSVKQASWAYEHEKTQKNYEKLMFLSNKRKDIIANFKVKQARKLVKDLDKANKRYICFTNSIKQLDWIRSNDSYIHSKRTGKLENKDIIENFNNKKTNRLFTVKMLTESANLVDIEEGIIVQLDKGKLTAIQRIGRVLRAYVPIVHLLVVRDTVDVRYLENSIEDIDKKYLNYYDIS